MFFMNAVGTDDVIKKSFLDQFTSTELTPLNIIATLLISALLGFAIYFTYLKTYRGVVYSQPFNASLVLMCVITSTIILTISSNAVLSLGMVGALSIVRFRAAIKDPLDIVYLFWSISVGIIVGAKQYLFALLATVLIGLLFFVILKLRGRKQVYLMIVRFDSEVQPEVGRCISKLEKAQVRSKNVSHGVTEMTIEVVMQKNVNAIVDRLGMTDGVHSAVLVSYTGDFAE